MVPIILLLPLISAVIAGFGWRVISVKGAQYLTTGVLFFVCLLSWIAFFTTPDTAQHVEIMRWIESGTLNASWGVRVDRLTTIMLVVVTTVSAFVHLYSIGYMAHDENFLETEEYRPRFFAYLSLFTFAMLALVTSDNIVQMFFGWEGVGLASYLLIGFYYKKPSAGAASIKAFVVNRIGDFGFLLGILGLFFLTDAIDFDTIFSQVPHIADTELHFLWRDWNAANLLAFLLFIGAAGKSAQLFLHTWLPDAMEGPTPVSALIHAATMVTAGVFLICRMSPLMESAPETMAFITFIGATTAFFAATVGLVQNDIKRVIAYSTCSQLGYMFAAAGVGAYGPAMFHLFTHAFFKALLFLSAGSVITAMHHEQDLRNYGGLKDKIPMTFWAMVIGTLAITGVGIPFTHIGFAGFLSKDAIIESVWAGTMGGYAFWMLVIAALFTSFYSWRLIFMTFFGEARGDKHAHEHAHESPKVMLIPLGVLSLGAILAGMIWYGPFFGDHDRMAAFFSMPAHHAEAAADHAAIQYGAIYTGPENHVIETAHEAPAWVKVSPFIAMLIGFGIAWVMYIKDTTLPKRLADANRPLYLFLLNKWYFDEIYDFLFVRPAFAVGRLFWKRGDGTIIDGTVNGVALGIVPAFVRLIGRWQSGYIFTYAFTMVIGIAALVTWMTLIGGAH
ncbi:NADH-quinone oxidoreductase subunit L [Pseudooceanicola sp. CBS1P-1]|uniref:NADH-quinone oxidoreductase subunit L n=1 Tax=Pseudooceanicola albus TaxID=2692189 RepID=A0A6L7FZ40_9RHOB|nr:MULTISPECIES: NADH-quinone oxidoreductase subunit L [Pseudooceanicola]MBT9382520.1 NADH-quinone oxidoreductase subunit L [Pseudooceanicola endophyticus]MXN17061.1 NADH-quinone oxidoreductase subunit L [Pseudooceanicola albus]